MSKHMTIINLACTITKLRKWGEAWKHSAESAQAATARMHQAHEAKMAEHRAAFGARTEADRKIIAGLREESAKCQAERDHFYQREGIEQKRRMDVEDERDGLLTQVQDMRAEMQRLSAQLDWERAEIKRLQWENATMHQDAEDGYAEAIKVLGDPIALSKERDALRAEVAELKTQLERLTSWAAKNQAARETMQIEIERLKSQSKAPKYKVGDKLESYNRSLGLAIPVTIVGVRTVYDCHADGAEYPVGHSEDELTERYAATHDTEAGKAAAESAIQGDRSGGIVVGDVVRATFWKPGQMSTVTQILPDGRLILEVSSEPWRVDEVVKLTRKCVGADEAWTDVRKVTT